VTDSIHELIVVGAGAAGLMTAVAAGRAGLKGVIALDGARTLGAKILVAGGGRCNVTHHAVHERDYAGATPAAIRRVLSRFTVEQTIDFFAGLGVELKREETGKLFPVTDNARTVLQALLRAAADVGVEIRHPDRVLAIETCEDASFRIRSEHGTLCARRVVLATGGRSLPKSGSDGAGLEMAVSLGHTLTERVVPSLVPLLLQEGHWLRELSGLALPAELRVTDRAGKRLARFEGSLLCTHFGLSGPVALDISRHWTLQRAAQPDVRLEASLLPDLDPSTADRWLLDATGRSMLSRLRERLPERMARAVLQACAVLPETTPQQLPKERRRELVRNLVALELPVTGDRGFTYAETTAGGVPLTEVRLETLESRVRPGLHLVGEMLDVDGRIGGFNFQWAWASGHVAGRAAAEALLES
jgi:predicted Rossmann fold flavoprotein